MAGPSVDNLVMKSIEALKVVLQSIAPLKGKVLFVTDEDSLMDELKGVKSLPGAGIIYEGMRAMPEQGGAKIGLSAEMVFSLVVINRGGAIVNSDTTKVATVAVLDEIRSIMIGTRSPTGHFWKFMVEAAAAEKQGTVFWVQRWATPIQIQQRN